MPGSPRSLRARVGRVPARACRPTASGSCMPEKRCSGLSSCTRAWGPPTPRGVAGLRSIFRAIAKACSERPLPVRHAHAGTLPTCVQGVLDLPARCRLRKRHASRRWKSGGARVPRRVPPSAFEWPRSSSNASCRLVHIVTSQLLRAAPATGERREGRFPPRSAGGGEPVGRAGLQTIKQIRQH